mmetsp:Transcript_4226/g.11389  ORF Transcript_4226/g.11389 Transcript_4226/m.11389 type:complete len:344 (-) Transcript_4226:863-1894(-)
MAGMATVGVSLAEKERNYSQAIAVLRALLRGSACPGRRGDWWIRLSIDIEHTKDDEAALLAAEAALKDPWVKLGDRLDLQRRVLRLGRPPRRWKRPNWATSVLTDPPEIVIEAKPLASNLGIKSRFYSLVDDSTQLGVEELALEWYASEAGGKWQGLHCEGGIWATLFGLLMWDIIFAPGIPDVFRTKFQTAPLDLGTEAFYEPRRNQIEARLQEIASGAAPDLLTSCWSQHKGRWCAGVNWDRTPLPELLDICRCVGGLGLSVVCRLLAEDYSGWRGGAPDLLLWRPEHGDARVSEVKGPRDRLSESQRVWLKALAAVDVRAEVLRVREPTNGPGGKKQRRK